MAALADLRPSVRLCKGIYVEPPVIAYQGRDETRESFVRVLDALLEAGCYAAVATHDEWLLERSLERVGGMPRDAYELQMLLGVRERASELVAAGHRLRVYVPYGDRWYEYRCAGYRRTRRSRRCSRRRLRDGSCRAALTPPEKRPAL